ncbi:hypothetical protein IJT17_05665 [bacterium]|nr:hypothetical protein [bacterium]
MPLPTNADKLGKAIKWGTLIFSAIFAADLSASALERSLMVVPEAVEIAASDTSEAKRKGTMHLSNLLREDETAPDDTAQDGDSPDGSTGGADGEAAASAAAVSSAQGLEGAVLRGTMVTGGYRAAMLEVGGETKLVPENTEVGDYYLQQVGPTWAYFAETDDSERGVRLVLDTMVEPEGEENAEASSDKGKKKDGDGDDKKKDEPVVVKERLSLDDIRAALNDTSKISSQVRVVPQAKDGQPYGTRLVFRNNDNIMSQLGLQNGDILLSINGNPARSVEDMYQGYMTLRNAESLEFLVDRDGNETTVRYELAH